MESALERDDDQEAPIYATSLRTAHVREADATAYSPMSVVRHCLQSGERCVIGQGPTWEDRRTGLWRYDCPSCGGQHEEDFRFHSFNRGTPRSRILDVPMEVDMGELIHGHHIVARGLQMRTLWGSVLHYDCMPAIELEGQLELDMEWGLGEVVDDAGTTYRQSGSGSWGPAPDGTANWGEKYLGNGIPRAATTLLIRFHQASRGLPEDSYSQSLLVDLAKGKANIQHY